MFNLKHYLIYKNIQIKQQMCNIYFIIFDKKKCLNIHLRCVQYSRSIQLKSKTALVKGIVYSGQQLGMQNTDYRNNGTVSQKNMQTSHLTHFFFCKWTKILQLKAQIVCNSDLSKLRFTENRQHLLQKNN